MTLGWDNSVLTHLKSFDNPGKVIGLITAPGPVILNDLRAASDAIIFNVMPGQQYGKGIMEIIFGRVSPSAKLTFTMPNKDNEMEMSLDQYPGSDGYRNSSYSEKHHIGYRWYDANFVKPAFEFGYGMSYSTFKYTNLGVIKSNDTLTVCFEVENTGTMQAREIA